MRICLYTETALPKLGGQEVVVDALAREFLALGHAPVVLAPWAKGKFPPRDDDLPYKVARHPRFISTRRFVSWYRHWLIRLDRERSFDVVHAHSVYPCGYVAALARPKVPAALAITSHGGDVREGNARFAKRGLRERHALAVDSADALVAISRFTADGFLRLGAARGKIVDLPNGVDLAPFAHMAERPAALGASIEPSRYILFLGRLHARKGVDVLLKALAAVNVNGIAPALVVAGDGDARPALERQARELGLADRAHFVGSVRGADKIWLLRNARGLVAPSRTWESFGLVVLEAYAAGIPVIASDLPGMADLIEPGETGWLARPDDVEELTKAIAELWSDAARSATMGRQAQSRVDAYHWNVIARRHIALYERLIAERGARRDAA